MEDRIFNIDGYRVSVNDFSKSQSSKIIYLIGEETEKLLPLVEDLDIVIVSIEGIDWERDLTPWEAPAAFKGQPDFSGKADDFLKLLEGKVMPEAEKGLTGPDHERAIAGYSLGGLFALYSAMASMEFISAASMSGSLWYDGWIDFVESFSPFSKSTRFYVSLGDKEERSRNPRMARVGDWTRKTCELLEGKGQEVRFEMNEGNHFFEIPERIAKGIRWVSEGK
jgi:hypothetical protein